jgi:uncharacterized protein GlcG (DUF336 family)
MNETGQSDSKKPANIKTDIDRFTLTKIIETVVKEVMDEYQPDRQKIAIQNSTKQNSAKQNIKLEEATALINLVEKEATLRGMSVVISVYNSAARPIAIHCMDDSYIASFDIANNKAYTSAALKMATADLKNLSQPGQGLYGIQHTNQGTIVIFGGGEPLIHDGIIIGALGVSGGTEVEDTKLAAFGKSKLEEVLKW